MINSNGKKVSFFIEGKILVVVLLIALFFSLFLVKPVFADTDQTAPEVTGIKIDKNALSIGERTTFTVDVVEEGTGINELSATYRNETTNHYYGTGGSIFEDGFWNNPAYTGRKTVTTSPVDESTVPGTYLLREILIGDCAGNKARYVRQEDEKGVFLGLENGGGTKLYEPVPGAFTLTITNSSYKGAPFVKSCKLNTKELKTGEKILVDMEFINFEPVDLFLW